jgi:hypothetical protein
MATDIRGYCVYRYFCMDTGMTFYVGHGTHERYRSVSGRSAGFDQMISECNWSRDLLAVNLTKHEAEDLERFYIDQYKRAGHPLVNLRYKGCGERVSCVQPKPRARSKPKTWYDAQINEASQRYQAARLC